MISKKGNNKDTEFTTSLQFENELKNIQKTILKINNYKQIETEKRMSF